MKLSAVTAAIDHSRQVELLMNVILFFIHPEQYSASVNLQEAVCANTVDERIPHHLSTWVSVFMGITWVMNRLTHPHRDRGGVNTLYDVIGNAGTASARMILCNLGLRVRYCRSDVVALTGRILTHEVPIWDGVDRVCLVRYVKADLFKEMGITTPSWSTVERVQSSLRMDLEK
jgi:hypothetical protein